MKQTLADALAQQGYDTLTPVQEAVTDPDLGMSDLLVSAQTGSGKTVGFGLAIAPTVLGDGDHFQQADAPLALVIAPTRELAIQVKRELSWLYGKAGAVLASCVGGMDMRDERRALARGTHIVVATPGRLRDHIMRGSLDMSALRAIILDEADEMLDLGFQDDLEFILGKAPETRRTLMFSATVPRGIANLAGKYQTDAIRISTTAEKSQHTDIEYRAMSVASRDAENALINVLRYYESPNALVFCNTRAMVNRMTTRLSNRGFSVVALSGELTQNERTHALQAMRDGRARVCVATDVAARGIDLPNLDLVVHAELPTSHETLLHRSGRTGRAGRKGVSALIVPPAARKKCERILRAAKITAEWGDAPSADAVTARDDERMLADPLWQEPVAEAEQAAVQNLVDQFSAEQLAAAYLHLYKSRQSAPEELSPSGSTGKPEPREAFGPSVWFSLAGGRSAGADPRRLLPMLCKAGDITRDDIGAIRIQNDESFFEIRQVSAAGFVGAIGAGMTVEGGAKVTQLDKPPHLVASPRPAYKGKPRDNTARDSKPRDSKPRDTKPRDDKPWDKKPRESKPYDNKPHDNKPHDSKPYDSKPRAKPVDAAPHAAPHDAPKPAPKPAPKGDSKPTDWNDAPKPRTKKPKPGQGGRPKSTPGAKPKRPRRPEDSRPEGVVEAYKGRRDEGAGGAAKPAKKRKTMAELASKPPPGKPSSKKNRARAKLIAEKKASAGDKPPKRRTSK